MSKVAKENVASKAKGVAWLFIPEGDAVRVAAYLRVSTDGQSVEHQRESLRAWVEAQGVKWESVEVFSDEGISGSKSERGRPSLARLMAAVRGGKLDRVVLFESSRASRAFLDYLSFLNPTGNPPALLGDSCAPGSAHFQRVKVPNGLR